jgi:3-oxoacyl-[acyl-carrier-protein] synthase III
MSVTLRSSKGSPYARILGVGGYRPSKVIGNEEILKHIDSSDEWIRSRSGIATRHWAGPEETVAEMSLAAAGKAIAAAGIRPEEVGAVVVSTVSHFKQTPSVATEIAHRLCTGRPAAFDISAACAGFGYGLALAKGMIVEGSAEYVLVVGVERLSDLTDLTDRSTAFLFGDGAGAVVLGPSQTPAMGPTVWGSEGDKADVISQTVPWDAYREGAVERFPAIRQEGQTVFRWATTALAPLVKETAERAGVAINELAAFVPHQANLRIIQGIAKRLDFSEDCVVAEDIVYSGNTSAASVPLALSKLVQEGNIPSGAPILLFGFGGGLTYAGQVIRCP